MKNRPPPGWGSAGRLRPAAPAALGLLACLLTALLARSPFNHYAVTSAAKAALFWGLPALYAARAGRRRILWPRPALGKGLLLLSAAVFAGVFAGFALLGPLIDRCAVVAGLRATGITRQNFLWIFGYIVLVNAPLEELFFRGFLYLEPAEAGGGRAASAVSAALFALYHLPILGGWVSPWLLAAALAGLFCAGLMFNETARRGGGASASLTVHLAANVALNLIGLYYFYGAA